MQIAEGDILKIVFNKCYGKYEFFVMQFGLTNAPVMFQTIINTILSPYIDKNRTAPGVFVIDPGGARSALTLCVRRETAREVNSLGNSWNAAERVFDRDIQVEMSIGD